ncbi:hypothetical protein [uncultured Apibacter sp.]|uniref:hypothetical protein n=1 Tax=uncultured Apibacter sp. TaxID=1778616 RepID=UPI0025EBF3F7|nr:hypothetical protein [uncultured Apibacter sp.]
METEHYIDGQHNGGVYNSFNLNTYGYCYQNPITMVDPNGKQAHFMHGTGDWDAKTYFNGSFENKFKARFGTFDSWGWSGSLYSRDNAFWNGKEGRISAGHRIAKNVIKSIKSNISGGKYRGKGIAIGGHSHGANVARVVAKDVYKDLSLMVSKGELDEIPAINLVMVNVPTIVNEPAYSFTPMEQLHINSIQVDSRADLVGGAGQGITGSGALTNEFYQDANSRIEYKDQLKIDMFGCGMSNHCGHADANVNVWYPKVEKDLK